jgi:hypothetical protein
MPQVLHPSQLGRPPRRQGYPQPLLDLGLVLTGIDPLP